MKDTDLMPFGKWKGTPMQDVPASYLAWLKEDAEKKGQKISHEGVRKYIEENWSVLQSEILDRIWE